MRSAWSQPGLLLVQTGRGGAPLDGDIGSERPAPRGYRDRPNVRVASRGILDHDVPSVPEMMTVRGYHRERRKA
jgi:hypothetical protein